MDMSPEIKHERWRVLWAAQRSQRYHARRMVFFETWSKSTAFVGIVGGSSVFASMGTFFPGWIGAIGASAVVLMSAIDLVVGTGEMARRHNDLRRRFCELEAKIVGTVVPSREQVASWCAYRLTIEADEPATYVALDILCANELARTYGHLAQVPVHQLPWYVRLTVHLSHWENA